MGEAGEDALESVLGEQVGEMGVVVFVQEGVDETSGVFEGGGGGGRRRRHGCRGGRQPHDTHTPDTPTGLTTPTPLRSTPLALALAAAPTSTIEATRATAR